MTADRGNWGTAEPAEPTEPKEMTVLLQLPLANVTKKKIDTTNYKIDRLLRSPQFWINGSIYISGQPSLRVR